MRLKEFRQKSFKAEFSLLIVAWYKVNCSPNKIDIKVLTAHNKLISTCLNRE